MKTKPLCVIASAITVFLFSVSFGQVAINNEGFAPDSSAMLDVQSYTKGLLPPRLTTKQRDSIVNPAEGLNIYNSTKKMMEFYNGTEWKQFYYRTSVISECGADFIDSRDGSTYSTVLIGNQCWMAENLNVGVMLENNSNQTNNLSIERWCNSNDLDSCNKYGGLYQWNEMMQYGITSGIQGICPAGWHLPSDTEWCTLENYVDSDTIYCDISGWKGIDAGGNLKEIKSSFWYLPNLGASNSSGFSALPGGFSLSWEFYDINTMGIFWSSTIANPNVDAYSHSVDYNNAGINKSAQLIEKGCSVRCIKNQ